MYLSCTYNFSIKFSQTFRVRTSSRLAAKKKLPSEEVSKIQDPDVQVGRTKTAAEKSHLVPRTRAAVQNFMSSSLSVVQNATKTMKKRISSNIGRKTKKAMLEKEKRYL